VADVWSTTSLLRRQPYTLMPLTDPRQLFADEHIDDTPAVEGGLHDDAPFGLTADETNDRRLKALRI